MFQVVRTDVFGAYIDRTYLSFCENERLAKDEIKRNKRINYSKKPVYDIDVIQVRIK